MFGRAFAILLALVVAACGSGTTSSPGPATLGGDRTTAVPATGTQPTSPPNDAEPGDLSGAVDALIAHDSWTFTSTINPGTDVARTQEGTERRSPELAIDFQVHDANGDYHYIRIGDDVWTDVGTGFFQFSAPDSPNLIEQYEPYLIEGLWEEAEGGLFEDMVEVGSEAVGALPAIHYRADDAELAEFLEIYGDRYDPETFAADIWTAGEGGEVLKLMYGPQSGEPDIVTGFVWELTALDCECPVEPPAESSTP